MPSLAALLDGGIEVPVVTRADKPVGRHAAVQASPIGQLAALRGIPTVKPEKVRGDAGFLAQLRSAEPDAAAVVAYGRMLPPEVLEVPRLGCVNVHASLLPRYRGASPIQAALLAGDRVTGVVTMRIEEELDAGPIYLERRVAIENRENAGDLSERLAREGASLLYETLRRLNAGDLAARPQAGEPSFASRSDARTAGHRLVSPSRRDRAPAARLHAVARRLHLPRKRADQAARRGSGSRPGVSQTRCAL